MGETVPDWLALDGSDLPEEVDVVVVGAGAAGAVVAARLCEDEDRRVLLLEAGTALPTETTRTPAVAYLGLSQQNMYGDVSTPQAGLGGRSVPVPTARGLGGGSSVNLLAWFQGHPADYDGWAASGASGWSYADVAPVFRQLEHHAWGGDRIRGSGGPMVISAPSEVEPLHLGFVDACRSSGVPPTSRLGASRLGAGLVDVNIRDGVRHSVVDGYLLPAGRRANLRIALGCEVGRITFERTRANGVELADGRLIRATERVIVCAGALRTPHLLMRSGVGPADQLTEHGIAVKVDSAGVGENLDDHPMVQAVWPVHTGRTWLDAQDEWATRAYRLARRGPLSTLPTTGAMLPLPGEGDAPSVQALFYSVGLGDEGPLPVPAATATVALLTPYSRGRVGLGADGPSVDPAYLSDPRDAVRLRDGLVEVRRIMKAEAMRNFCGPAMLPAEGLSVAELDAWVRHHARTQWHPVGSARMGLDDHAPVDPGLAVKGTEALNVVDASVMPAATRGNTQAPTIMIAERAAAMLR